MAIVLVGGGARSGKSRYALELAQKRGPALVFLATAEPFDSEMEARIAKHRAERHSDFTTIEEPLDIAEKIRNTPADAMVVDCLTLWLSNLLVRGATADEARARVDEVRAALARRRVPVVIVTNEVGMGLVPETPLGRVFRDLSGLAHQRLAAEADELHVAVMGVVLRLRPDPIAVTPVTVDLPI